MSLQDQPLLAYFGSLDCEPLGGPQAQAADFDVRVKSIGRLLVREVLKMHSKMSPEGQASYDAEDLFLEIWIELKKRNDKFDHKKSGYRRFALLIAYNKYQEILKRARCVRMPSDSDEQFKRGDKQKVERLARIARDHDKIGHEFNSLIQDRQPSPQDGLIWLEENEQAVSDVAEHIGNLTINEAIAISTTGVWGHESKISEAAKKYNVKTSVLRRALESAKRKLHRE